MITTSAALWMCGGMMAAMLLFNVFTLFGDDDGRRDMVLLETFGVLPIMFLVLWFFFGDGPVVLVEFVMGFFHKTVSL